MGEYRVETVHVTKKYSCILIEAESEKQALEKARTAEESEFLEREFAESCEWTVKNGRGWLDLIAIFFGSKR